MSDDPKYDAFVLFARSTMRAEKAEMKHELFKELRAEFKEILTREAPKVSEGPPGPPGKDGADGKDGRDGKDGIDGKPGERGADGIIGRDGKDGLNGTDGKPGEKGERGADGIATRAELESIIETRMADIQVRTFADMYQGVWEPVRDYTRSQAVTWGGQVYLALADTRGKPAESPDWRLIVKAGRDGKR